MAKATHGNDSREIAPVYMLVKPLPPELLGVAIQIEKSMESISFTDQLTAPLSTRFLLISSLVISSVVV